MLVCMKSFCFIARLKVAVIGTVMNLSAQVRNLINTNDINTEFIVGN